MPKSRRGRGEGSITQRDRAGRVWQLKWDTPSDGRRIQRSETIKGVSKGEASKTLREIMRALDHDTLVGPTKESLGAYLERWLHDYADRHTSPITARDYRSRLTSYIIRPLGSLALVRFTRNHIEQTYRRLRDEGKSETTLYHLHAVLRQALRSAVDERSLERSPMEGIRSPRPQRREYETVGDRLAEFFTAIEASPYTDVYALCLLTGLRRSEALGLQWPRVNLDAGTARVEQGLHRVTSPDPDKRLVLLDAKTPSSRATIAVPLRAIERLRRLKAKQLEAESKGEMTNPEQFVFVRADGKPYAPDVVTKDFTSLMRQIGFKGLRLHDLRHSFVSYLIALGAHPKEVQEAARHSSFQITMDTYGHLMEGAAAGWAKDLDRLVTESLSEPLVSKTEIDAEL